MYTSQKPVDLSEKVRCGVHLKLFVCFFFIVVSIPCQVCIWNILASFALDQL